MSRVIPTVACPRRSDTTLGWTPARSRRVAWAWRRSWNRTWGRPERITRNRHAEDMESGLTGEPSPRSDHQVGADPPVPQLFPPGGLVRPVALQVGVEELR